MKSVLSMRRRNKTSHSYTVRNSVEWVQSGSNYFDRLINLIDASTKEIHIQTYIFDSDETGNRVAEALIKAAKRKVKIFVFVDAFGSQEMSSEIIRRFIHAGIHFKKYGLLYSRGSFHIGRRMHHKINVFDGIVSMVGGINISDNYNDMPGSKAWLDFAVIMKGDISRHLLVICRKRWKAQEDVLLKEKIMVEEAAFSVKGKTDTPIRMRRNDFVRNKNDIAISYREAFRHSRKSILLVGGYFLPGRRTRKLMKIAANRGVKIDVIVSEKSDVKIHINARRFLYTWLIRNKINVFEYQPSNVHGKVLIVDGKWTSIGSYDLNNLSTYSNIELNVDIDEETFSAGFEKNIREILKTDCAQISAADLQKGKNIFSNFIRWASYRMVKSLFVLSVLLAGKKEKDF